jgi:membrane protein involved in colicin uptake
MSGDPSDGSAQSDAEKRKTEADARKAEADARKAEAEAKKAERENEQADSPGAKAEKDAEQRKAEAEANLDAAKARRDEVATLIPDFSAIKDSTLEVKGDQPLFGIAMSQRALADSAAVLAKDVNAKLQSQGDVRLLVTADEHLATSDAAYVDVTRGLDQLTEA